MCKKKDPNKKGFFGEFKEFITRGNVLDMAVGVIIGGAFTAIVTALTGGILQPVITLIISAITGNSGLESARTPLGEIIYKVVDHQEIINDGSEVVHHYTKEIDWSQTIHIDWGAFITAIINFLLVALILFIIIKVINGAHEKGVAAKEALLKKANKEEPAEEKKAE